MPTPSPPRFATPSKPPSPHGYRRQRPDIPPASCRNELASLLQGVFSLCFPFQPSVRGPAKPFENHSERIQHPIHKRLNIPGNCAYLPCGPEFSVVRRPFRCRKSAHLQHFAKLHVFDRRVSPPSMRASKTWPLTTCFHPTRRAAIPATLIRTSPCDRPCSERPCWPWQSLPRHCPRMRTKS